MTAIGKKELFTFAGGTSASRTAMRIPKGITFDKWLAVLQHMIGIGDAAAWWIGDLLTHGEWNYAEKYRTVLAELELSYDRVRNYAYVSGNVPAAVRRSDLSWSHHREVAKLIPVDQEQWLKRAADERWSVRTLVEQMRLELGPTTALRSAVLEQLRFTIDPDRLSRYTAAAEHAEATVQDWAIAVLDVAAADV